MIRRLFRPGLAGDPDDSATALRLFERGSAAEPAHRSIVEVEFATGRTGVAAYDRRRREFHLWLEPGKWMKLERGDVIAWYQRRPRPRRASGRSRFHEGGGGRRSTPRRKPNVER